MTISVKMLMLILVSEFLSFAIAYQRLPEVKQIHALPHYDNRFYRSSSEFALDYDNAASNNAYVYSIYRLPLICGGLGMLAVLIFQFFWTTRACFRKLKCLPKVLFSPGAELNHTENIGESSTSIPMVRNLYIAFGVTAFCVLFSNQAQLFGRENFVEGVTITQNGLDYIEDLFSGLSDMGVDYVAEISLLSNNFTLANATCNAKELLDTIPQFTESASQYQAYVDPISEIAQTARRILYTFATNWQDKCLWSLYGIINFIAFFYGVGIWLKGPRILRFTVGATQVVMLGLFMFCGIEMAALMISADFCMEPTKYAAQVMPLEVADVTNYYISCVGEHPIGDGVIDARSLIANTIIATQYLLNTTCQNNTYLEQSLITLNNIDSIGQNIVVDIDCPPTQAVFLNVLHEGFCTQAFIGFYLIWVNQVISTSFLLATSIVVALLYQFFDPHWDDKQQRMAPLEPSDHDNDHNDHKQPHDGSTGDSSIQHDIEQPQNAYFVDTRPQCIVAKSFKNHECTLFPKKPTISPRKPKDNPFESYDNTYALIAKPDNNDNIKDENGSQSTENNSEHNEMDLENEFQGVEMTEIVTNNDFSDISNSNCINNTGTSTSYENSNSSNNDNNEIVNSIVNNNIDENSNNRINNKGDNNINTSNVSIHNVEVISETPDNTVSNNAVTITNNSNSTYSDGNSSNNTGVAIVEICTDHNVDENTLYPSTVKSDLCNNSDRTTDSHAATETDISTEPLDKTIVNRTLVGIAS